MVAKTHKEVLKKALADEEFRKEYEGLKPEFELRRALIYLRKSLKMTQHELAETINSKQEYVSRIEQGRVELSVPYLAKLVQALGADIEITLKPKDGREPIVTRVGTK